MPGEFENGARVRLQDFRISPGPQVWKQVEAALPEEKRKRRFAIWWWLPLGLLLGGGIWYAANNINNKKEIFVAGNKTELADKKEDNIVKKTKTLPGSNTNTLKPVIQKKEAEKKNPVSNSSIAKTNPASVNVVTTKEKKRDGVVSPEKAKTVKNKLVIARSNDNLKKISHTEANRRSDKNSILSSGIAIENKEKQLTPIINTQDALVNSGIGANGKTENQKSEEAFAQTETVKSNTPLIITDSSNITTIEKVPETLTALNNDVPAKLKNTDTTNAQSVPERDAAKPLTQKKISKPATWSFTVAAGISNTKEPLIAGQNKSLSYASPNSFLTGQGGSNADFAVRKSTRGFSYALGVERIINMGKKWKWYSTIQYSFLSNYQRTGNRKDSAIGIADYSTSLSNNNSRNNGTVQAFYYTGGSITHRNTLHQLGFETGMQYTFKPAASKPFSIRGGITFNQQLATNQLLYDAIKGAYYYAPNATQHFTFGTQWGLDWRLGKRLSVGAFLQYNFTKINNVEMGSYLHWQMTGVKVGIPLTNH